MSGEITKNQQLARDLRKLDDLLEDKRGWLLEEAQREKADAMTRIQLRFVASLFDLARQWINGLRYKVDGV